MPRGTDRYNEARLQRRLFDATHCSLYPVTYFNFNRRESLVMAGGLITVAKNLGRGGGDMDNNIADTVKGFPPLLMLPNNVSVASFATTDALAQSTTSGLVAADPTQTIISLARIKVGGTANRVIQGSKLENFVIGFYLGLWDIWYDSTGFRTNNSPVVTYGEFRLTTLRSSAIGYNPSGRGDGVALSCNTAVGSAPLRIGINTDNFNENSDCDVFAVAVWYGALSDADICRVEGAFAWEAGQQNVVLAPDHPYRNRPPLIGE